VGVGILSLFDEDWFDFTRIPPPGLSFLEVFFFLVVPSLVASPVNAKADGDEDTGFIRSGTFPPSCDPENRARVPLFPAVSRGSMRLRTTLRLRRSMLLCKMTGSVVGRKAVCGFVAYNILDRFNEFMAEIDEPVGPSAVLPEDDIAVCVCCD